MVSYNRPALCSGATWGVNASNFANSSIVRSDLSGIFVNANDTVYATNGRNNEILIWSNNSNNQSVRVLNGSNSTSSLVVTIDEDIYVNSGYYYHEIVKWSKNTNNKTLIINVWNICFDLFLSVDNFLYCAMPYSHTVGRSHLINSSSMIVAVAGTGCSGVTADMLYYPHGIFVHTNLSLYVADCGNDRIQLFQYQKQNGTTIAGNGAPGTIILNCPTDVVLDGNEHLFIVDQDKHRIVRSMPGGFRCIAGCSEIAGSAPDQLNTPRGMAFDSHGNIFVIDRGNDRIQKYLLLTDGCGEYS